RVRRVEGRPVGRLCPLPARCLGARPAGARPDEGRVDRPLPSLVARIAAMAGASDDLRSLADRYWDGYLAAYPTWATVIGDRRFDDRLEDVSPDAIAARIRWLDGVVAAGEALNQQDLTPTE